MSATVRASLAAALLTALYEVKTCAATLVLTGGPEAAAKLATALATLDERVLALVTASTEDEEAAHTEDAIARRDRGEP